jgi:hypothetical protein
MSTAQYIGWVGGLAVALGIGAALAAPELAAAKPTFGLPTPPGVAISVNGKGMNIGTATATSSRGSTAIAVAVGAGASATAGGNNNTAFALGTDSTAIAGSCTHGESGFAATAGPNQSVNNPSAC